MAKSKRDDSGSLEDGNVNLTKKRSHGSNRTAKSVKKIFVLDTNVILHDSACVYKFEEHDICIPIQVLEELDNHKKGLESINFHAREFNRIFDEILTDDCLDEWVPLGEGLGKIKALLKFDVHEKVSKSLDMSKVDNQIINDAYVLQESLKNEKPKVQVVIVSKDLNVRTKSKILGIVCQDYLNEKVSNVDFLFNGIRTLESDTDFSLKLFSDREMDFQIDGASENENFILKLGGKDIVVRYRDGKIKPITKSSIQKPCELNSLNVEQTCAIDALLDPSIKLVVLEGGPGTGKTLISLACGFEQLGKKIYNKVLFAVPAVPMGNRDIGFLPGDVNDKISPYAKGVNDNVHFLAVSNAKNKKKIDSFIKSGQFIIEALAHLRGRSLPKVFFIVDEAQNLTPLEVKTIITRAGEGTKIIFMADTGQIDNPFVDQKSNGATYLINKFSKENDPIFSYVHLTKSERSELARLAIKIL